MALNATGIATAIAGLSVSGVTIRDLTAIPTAIDARDVPAMWPKPDGFMSDLEVEVNSFGSGAGKKTVRYSLTYVFAHAPVGSARGLFDVYQAMVGKTTAVLDAVIASDSLGGSAIDIQPVSTVNYGLVTDPSGAAFYGCELVFAVMEFVN